MSRTLNVTPVTHWPTVSSSRATTDDGSRGCTSSNTVSSPTSTKLASASATDDSWSGSGTESSTST